MAVIKIGFDVADLIVRNLRLAGRADIDRLGRQLARTEDKLELLLQEIEALRAETRADDPPSAP
jgi:BMFP domain-containing protein YqiC